MTTIVTFETKPTGHKDVRLSRQTGSGRATVKTTRPTDIVEKAENRTTPFGPAAASAACPLSGDERTRLRRVPKTDVRRTFDESPFTTG